jgi:hypothetical protein
MGCDIHSYCEVEIIGQDNVGRWFCIGRVFMDEDGSDWGSPVTYHPIDERNYDLFGILANVRNGTWGDALKPISEPRGIPDNVSAFVRKQFDSWSSDGHSHSYVSLEEIENYDWEAKIHKVGCVSEEQKADFERTSTPPTCYSAYGSNGVYVEWDEPISSVCPYFMKNTLPVLRELSKHGKVRLVFWFDN